MDDIDREELLIFMGCANILLNHIEVLGANIIEGAYKDIDDMKDDIKYALKRLKVVRDKEKTVKEMLGIKERGFFE